MTKSISGTTAAIGLSIFASFPQRERRRRLFRAIEWRSQTHDWSIARRRDLR